MSLSLPQAVLDQARALHEANMPDRCDIHRESSRWDETAQATVTEWTPVHSDVPCRLPVLASAGRVIVTGETVTPANPVVRVPLDTTGIRPDDRITITHAAQDPELVGTVMWVTHNRVRSLNTARYLDCRWIQ